MPRKRTGQVRFRKGKWFARVTLKGKERPSFELPTVSDEASARKRATLLSEIAGTLREAGQLDLAPTLLLKAAAASESQLGPIKRLVAAAAAGNVVKQGDREGMTFGEVAKLWTSGELARRHPDHVKVKRSVSDDMQRLEMHILPIVGGLPAVCFTLDHAEQVMGSLPSRLARNTRRNIAVLIHRVMGLAVFPMRLRDASPLPRGWLPKPGKLKAKPWLYPAEERKLMGCVAVPLNLRLLYGFLAREGMRKGEALSLRWRSVDLERGVVVLDENKTNDPRAWALGDDVAAALVQWRALNDDVGPDDAVFVDGSGAPRSDAHPATLRGHLAAAGVDRPQLFERIRGVRDPINVHSLRGTFVTLALACGRSEAWVADRTGHRSSTMINRYKRAARTASELDLGWLAPLHEAIPELKRRRKGAGTKSLRHQTELSGGGERIRTFGGREPTAVFKLPERGRHAVSRAIPRWSSASEHESHGSAPFQGPLAPFPDAVEVALAEAITKAANAGRFDVVAALVRELETRRRARDEANLVRLDVAKRKH